MRFYGNNPDDASPAHSRVRQREHGPSFLVCVTDCYCVWSVLEWLQIQFVTAGHKDPEVFRTNFVAVLESLFSYAHQGGMEDYAAEDTAGRS
jgi:hypothetical protein